MDKKGIGRVLRLVVSVGIIILAFEVVEYLLPNPYRLIFLVVVLLGCLYLTYKGDIHDE